MRKLLILLGASKYPRYKDLALPSFIHSHAAFKAAMVSGRNSILEPSDCLDLFDDNRSWCDQQIEIDEWVRTKKIDDESYESLILYYVGHGGIEKGDKVYLTINSTHKLDPYYSSIPRDSLAKLFRSSASDLKKFLIIDCCFAASVLRSMMSTSQEKMNLELREIGNSVSKSNSGGLAALCASSSITTANGNGLNGLTQFTDGLLSALLTGDPSTENNLSFESILPLIERQLHERYGSEAVPPSSYFADDFYEPIHKLEIFPNRAERPLSKLQVIEENIMRSFRDNYNRSIPPFELQKLARPIEYEAVQLKNTSIIEKMFTRKGDAAVIDAAIFTAAVIIYKRQEKQFLPDLLNLSSNGRPVRAAVMWRILKAIKRILPHYRMDSKTRDGVIKSLSNCSKYYDSPEGHRFKSRDVILLVAQISELRIVDIDLRTDEIFSADQLSDWLDYKNTKKKNNFKFIIPAGWSFKNSVWIMASSYKVVFEMFSEEELYSEMLPVEISAINIEGCLECLHAAVASKSFPYYSVNKKGKTIYIRRKNSAI